MDDVERMRISQDIDEKVKNLVEEAGFSTTDEVGPGDAAILDAMRKNARKVVRLAAWRLELPDAIGHRLGPDEVMDFARTLYVLLREVGRLARERCDSVVIVQVRLDSLAPHGRPDWLAEWRTANPGRVDDHAETILERNALVQFPGEWSTDEPEMAAAIKAKPFRDFDDSFIEELRREFTNRNGGK